MSLGDALASALTELRGEAESMMRDQCVITGPGGEPVWDDATGTYTTPDGATLYTGKCRVRQPSPAGGRTDSGVTAWTVDHAIVSLPLAGTDAIGPGSVIAITSSAAEPSRAGWKLTVEAGHYQTDSTARRLPCKVVSRDA